jgi:para-nitrobenzyl esterase
MPVLNSTCRFCGVRISISDGPIDVEVRDGVVRARGLPYGTASRFDAAVAPELWTGPRDAKQPGPTCPQRPCRLDFIN